MVALQIISKILSTKDISIIDDNLLTVDYFVGYENEYKFIISFVQIDNIFDYEIIFFRDIFISKKFK